MVVDGDFLAPGVTLHGVYVLESVLGRGGFGVTYLAVDLQSNTRVAIKEYFPDFCAMRMEDGHVAPIRGRDALFAKFLADFKNEALALSGFDHPNIVPVIAQFEALNTAYFVMPFIEGESLEDATVRPISTQAVMAVAEGLIEAVKTLHDHDMLHRDIKPGNVRLARLDQPGPTRLPDLPYEARLRFGRPILLDFGAARTIPRDGRSLTGIATPHYGAPEQLTERGKQDVRTDIYGLGATLYCCLAAEPPPRADERLAQDALAPARQRFADIAPPNFLTAIDRALQLRPQHRPQTIREFRSELFADLGVVEWTAPGQTFSDVGIYGRPSQVAPSSTVSQPSQRRGAGGAIVAAIVGAALIGAGAFWWLTQPGGSVTARQAGLQVDLILNQMALADTTPAQIANLQVFLDDAAKHNVAIDAADYRDRISDLQRSARQNYENGLSALRQIHSFARANPAEFEAIMTRLEQRARAEARPKTARRLSALRTLIQNSRNGVDERAFSSFWEEEVSDLSD
ncbi:MAG: protein kinase [Alphaproteobacteria bacterium]|nr:protein kinase [Alphaproteobacteria bacterium]